MTYKNGAVVQRWFGKNSFADAIEAAEAAEVARLVWRLDALDNGAFILSIFPDEITEADDE